MSDSSGRPTSGQTGVGASAGLAAEGLAADGLAELVLRRTSAFVVLLGERLEVLDVNAAALQALGCAAADVVGRDATAVLCQPRQAVDLLHALRRITLTGEPSGHEHELPTEQRTSVAWTSSLVSDDPQRLACVGVDVTAARHEAEDALTRAMTDELTGLPNRAHLLKALNTMSGTGVSVLFCDLNAFKAVNDTHGHAAGDAVLVEVARRLRRAVRGEDLVARLGGDEFVILAPPDPRASPEGLTRRVLSAMRQPMLLAGGVVVVVGVSVGIAQMQPGQDPDQVLRLADASMYRAKSLRRSVSGRVTRAT
ncbi:MAG: GGDEF domain-containing protein [Actinobacteria bacterium]|nr:GGDEF domain-containing protein [Actinomycetota bacterium]MCA1720108.1 GGDEF domain-containing protein [Actinomycetota bacterium]